MRDQDGEKDATPRGKASRAPACSVTGSSHPGVWRPGPLCPSAVSLGLSQRVEPFLLSVHTGKAASRSMRAALSQEEGSLHLERESKLGAEGRENGKGP